MLELLISRLDKNSNYYDKDFLTDKIIQHITERQMLFNALNKHYNNTVIENFNITLETNLSNAIYITCKSELLKKVVVINVFYEDYKDDCDKIAFNVFDSENFDSACTCEFEQDDTCKIQYMIYKFDIAKFLIESKMIIESAILYARL